VKDVKSQMKYVPHHLGHSNEYKVLMEYRRILIVRAREKPKPEGV